MTSIEPWMILLLVPLSRLAINLNNWAYMVRARKKHLAYVSGLSKDADEKTKKAASKAFGWLTSNLVEIRNRVLKSGVEDQTRVTLRPLGFNKARPAVGSVLTNLTFPDDETLGKARQLLAWAAGSYRSRAIQSVNPLFWLEVIFFLPKTLVSATGIEITSKAATAALHLAQALYWLAFVWLLLARPDLITQFLSGHSPQE